MNRSIAIAFLLSSVGCSNGNKVVVGSKSFTESIILGELVAQSLERAGISVKRKLNLSGTFINHEAMTSGQMDIYVEYTGTAHSAVLQLPHESDPATVRNIVDSVYAERWNLEWMTPLGFNNTFAILVRKTTAEEFGLTKVSDLSGHVRTFVGGFGHEFLNRADGYDGFTEHYRLEFENDPVAMDLGLIYRALNDGQVDVIAGNSTDGQIEALNLFRLADDLGFFPPYEAVPLVRAETLERYPRIRGILDGLGGTITETEMARMNYLVDVERKNIRELVSELIDSRE